MYVMKLKYINVFPHIEISMLLIYFTAVLCLTAHCIFLYARGFLYNALLYLGERFSYKHEEATRCERCRPAHYGAQFDVFSHGVHNELFLPEASNMAYRMGYVAH
jgi:uncharacterized membrane protein YjgN (DUF898 family)